MYIEIFAVMPVTQKNRENISSTIVVVIIIVIGVVVDSNS